MRYIHSQEQLTIPEGGTFESQSPTTPSAAHTEERMAMAMNNHAVVEHAH